ncbi:transport and Golgi organization protein 2 [Epargyreus clarus]|uniref:transport and Golgi organization protein 2 n=1 Tax=Epargyreus clarus TaxID=520877 RepID=UPI003C2AF1AE
MCILLTYSGVEDEESDYSYIVASNRDEFYYRPTQNMVPWVEDSNVYGGRDLEPGSEGGTWLGVCPLRKKIAVLLNLPGANKEKAKSRGKIVEDFVKSDTSTCKYTESMKDYFQQCNGFVFVSIELGKTPVTQTYSNATNKLDKWVDTSLAFGNCTPDNPLKKVQVAKNRMAEICSRLNKIDKKTELIEELINLLKSKEQHLPDPQLEKRQPHIYKQLSSIFVEVPVGQYGTRTHTLILVTKTGHMDVIEITLQAPIDLSNPNWQRTEFQFDVGIKNSL